MTKDTYSASDGLDVRYLAKVLTQVANSSLRERGTVTHIAAEIMANKLMLNTHPFFRVVFWLMRRRGNPYYRMKMFYDRAPRDVAESVLQQTADHMINGRDREDTSSIGGFSQREMDILTNILRNAGIST